MSSLHNRVETTVSAAADAIVTAETRFHQPSTLQKRRWGRSCWNLCSCFGSYKQSSSSKRVGPAALPSPEPARPGIVSPMTNNHRYYSNNNNNVSSSDNSSTLARPFLVPPSSPASFLPSHSPSCPHSPAGPASSAHAKSSNSRNTQMYAIGPYAHEADQLVSPPTFSSAFTTEPSTASYTSPPEPARTTTEPSSPDVPFARVLSSSFATKQGYDGNYDNNDNYYSLSQYEFQPYHQMMSDYGTSPYFSIDTSPHEPYSWDWGSSVGSGSNLIHESDNDGEYSYRDCDDQNVEFAWSLGWA